MLAALICCLLDLSTPGFEPSSETGDVTRAIELYLRIQDVADSLNAAKWLAFLGAYPSMIFVSWACFDRWYAVLPLCAFLAVMDCLWLLRQKRVVKRKIVMRIGSMLDGFFEELAGLSRTFTYAKIQASVLGNLEAGFSPADIGKMWDILIDGAKIGCMYCMFTGSKWGASAANALSSMQRVTTNMNEVLSHFVAPLRDRMASRLLNRAGLGYRSFKMTCRRAAVHVLPYAPIAGGIVGSVIVAGTAVLTARWARQVSEEPVASRAERRTVSKAATLDDKKAVDSNRKVNNGPCEAKGVNKGNPKLVKSGKTANGRYWAYDDDDEQYLVFQSWEGMTRVGPDNRMAFYQWVEGQEDEYNDYADVNLAEESGSLTLEDVRKIPVDKDAWTRDRFADAQKKYNKRVARKKAKNVRTTETQTSENGPAESSLGKAHLDVSKLPMARLYDPVHKGWQNAPIVQGKVLVYKHTLDAGKESSKWVLKLGDKEAPMNFNEMTISKVHRDVVYFPLPKTFQGVKSCSLRMDTKLSNKEGVSAVKYGYFGEDMSKPNLSSGMMWSNLRHSCSSGGGSCGSYMVDMAGPSPAIVGFHSHGDNGTRTNGYYPLTDQMMEELRTLKLTSKN